MPVIKEAVWKHPEWLDHAKPVNFGGPLTTVAAGSLYTEDAQEMEITSGV